jgi:hypothetical protein
MTISERKVISMFFRLFLLFGLVWGGFSVVQAQMPQQPRRYGGQNYTPRVEKVRIDGILKNKKPGVLLVTTDNLGDLLVGFGPKTQIAFRGEATSAMLRAGMCVTFKATVDPKGNTTDKIDELSVFSPTQDKPLGLFPEGDEEKPDRSKKPAKKAKEPVLCEVRGKIMNYNPRDGRVQVQTGRGIVRGQITDSIKIPVEISDASFFAFTAPGDKVAAEVVPIGRNRNQVMALALKIESAKAAGEGEQAEPANPADRKKAGHELKPAKSGPDNESPAPQKALTLSGKAQPAADKGLPAPANDK